MHVEIQLQDGKVLARVCEDNSQMAPYATLNLNNLYPDNVRLALRELVELTEVGDLSAIEEYIAGFEQS